EQPAQDTEQEERVRQPQTRRKQRQLTQKVRYTDSPAVEAEVATAEVVTETAVAQPTEQPVPAQRTELAKVDLPAVVATEQEDNSEARDSNGMPRRSRRSPRHLRVSGQRRRRYRDERYPVQSPMPLMVACASPELASGKVWIRYPVARPQDQQVAEQREQETPVAVEPQVAAAAVEHIVNAPASVETVQPEVVIAEPQATVVETTHPEVIATPVEEQPQIIAESDAPVAEDTAAKAEPVAEIVAAPVVEESAEVVISQPEVAEEIAEVVETAPVVEEVAAPQEVVAAPVVEDAVAKAEVVATRVDAEHLHSHAAAPMTRAPAPEYVPEAPRHSDWQRPEFTFEGKGAAGGHSATHQATAPATRPQPVE
ncbi:MAG: ribonuclease E, partial [Citrobacter sp.]